MANTNHTVSSINRGPVFDKLKDAVGKLASIRGRDATCAALKQFNIATVYDLKPGQYAALAAVCETALGTPMTAQKITADAARQNREALNEASIDLGKAWGLAETCCTLTGEREGSFDVEGILRSVARLIEHAAGLMHDREIPHTPILDALAVCNLVMADSQETSYGIHSASMWALEALPNILRRAKDSVDADDSKQCAAFVDTCGRAMSAH